MSVTTTTTTVHAARDLSRRPGNARTEATGAGAGLGLGLAVAAARAAHRGVATLRLWRERARQRRQLAAMDDHLLQDIGLSRVQAEVEFQKPFWRL